MAIGLYVHVPFCVRKCRYCSFTSYPREDGAVTLYLGALAREIEMRAGSLSREERLVDSIYIGGGTPTCLEAGDLEAVLDRIYSSFTVSAGAEITVEANPGTVDREKLARLRKAGVNRLSLGFQACRPELLATLGRIHTWPEAVASFREARRAGFDNINTDLIFGIPGQGPEQWAECLEEVAGLGPDHISAYGLQLEEGTPLFLEVGQGLIEPCTEDLEADMYQDLRETLSHRGYIQYEISNFSLPGRECRHNLRYWHNLSYLGLGPSAHSFLGGRRFSNDPSTQGYAGVISSGQFPVCWQEETGRRTEMSETMFLGLRLLGGVDLEEFRKRFGESAEDVYRAEIDRLAGLGLVEAGEGRVRLTPRGVMLGNVVFMEFV